MAPMAIVGVVGGVSEGADALFGMLSGWFSDKIGKREILAVSGYSRNTIAKLFLDLKGVPNYRGRSISLTPFYL